MAWTPRIKPIKIRCLYRSARLGIYDNEALQEVGSELYARCSDIAAVADAHRYGKVPCPECGTKAQRQVDAQYGLEGHGNFNTWFSCPHCSKQLVWTDCREALRENPRCFSCLLLLEGKGDLKCRCGKKWDDKAYRRSVSTRVRLPCPHCHEIIRKPTINHKNTIAQESKVKPSTQEVACPKCTAMALHSGGFIECSECGYKRRWRDYRKGQKRKDETLICPDCKHSFKWQAWRKDAGSLVTGNPQPARDFVAEWPKCRTPQASMMKIDFLLQTLHGRGPLAPLFIEGDEKNIRLFLDELASQT